MVGKTRQDRGTEVAGLGADVIFSVQSRFEGVVGKRVSGNDRTTEVHQANMRFTFCFSPGCSLSKVHLAVTDENIAQRPSKPAKAGRGCFMCQNGNIIVSPACFSGEL